MSVCVEYTYDGYADGHDVRLPRERRETEREEERETLLHYTPHNVVQTPWARRTAFQGGSMDKARDGVRVDRREEEGRSGGYQEEEEERLVRRNERDRKKERKRAR